MNSTLQLFNYLAPDGRRGVGIEYEGDKLDFSRAWATFHALESGGSVMPPGSTDEMLGRGNFTKAAISRVLDHARTLQPEALASLKLKGDWKWAAPVLKPGKIIALVQNYRKHAEEFGNTPPEKIVFFAKFPSTMLPHMGEIVFPGSLNSRVDHEVELGVVIGKTCFNVGEDRAMDHIAGYTIVNDVSARHLQKELRDAALPWMPSKNLDTFCPIGPYLVPRDAIENPQHLAIRCKVNSEVRQNGTTEDMLHPVKRIVSALSRTLTLEVGDVIATGTPEGVGKLSIGDNVVCEI
ncbi:MAG: fumarylacetoacetate hydrolase family protein, partial [Planctomycetes bacterium]|nr:fumarylacetoacetate hydrolase family protein [Planctomycetota bacterium]